MPFLKHICQWDALLVIAMLSIQVACLSTNNRNQPSPKNPDDETTTPSIPSPETILADYQPVIRKNGTSIVNGGDEHQEFEKDLKEKGNSTLLAVTHIETVWEIQLQNKNGKPFYSKLIPPTVTGEGLSYDKIDFHNHVYQMKNYFTKDGDTEVLFTIAAKDICQEQYNDNRCAHIETMPHELKVTMKVPIKVIDLGYELPEDTKKICDLIQAGGSVLGLLTKQDSVSGILAKSAEDIMKLNNNCRSSSR
ncbi:MAG: hypothetical protein OXC44_04870 [Proteobacteria bacterium]|nr:hypothetical protein [Pseudomonadota bacterium]